MDAFDVKNKETRAVCANLIRNVYKIYMRRKLKKRLAEEAATALAAAEAAKKKKKGKKEGEGEGKKKKKSKKKKGEGAKKGKGKKKKAGNNEDLATELSEPLGGEGQAEEGQEDEPEGEDDEKEEEGEEGALAEDRQGEDSPQRATEEESAPLPRRTIKVKKDGS